MAKTTIDKSAYVLLGEEPKYQGPVTTIQLSTALNWYNYFYSPTTGAPRPSECLEWIVEYMEGRQYSRDDIATFKKVPNKEIPTTLCSLARLLNNGAVFEHKLDARIAQLIHQERVRPEIKYDAPIVDHSNQIIAELDDLIDTFFNSEYKYLPETEDLQITGNREEKKNAIVYYTELLDELNSQDPDIKEGYKHISAAGMKRYRALIGELLTKLGKMTERKPIATRKPRAPKKKTDRQLLGLLQYQKAEKIGSDMIESVNPSRILDSTVVWTYNTRKRLLTKYVSNNSPISVHRTTLKGFDPELSLTKKIRKPEIIKQIAVDGKAVISKLFDKIKAKPQKVTGRMNDETLILRTFK